jgi:dihydroxyacetone kinase-like predicted kinase
MNDIDIKEGDIIGIGESKMLTSGKEKSDVTISLIDKLVDEDSAIITLLYGEEISEEDANELKDMVEEKYPDLEVELYYGGQPVYYYLVSVE